MLILKTLIDDGIISNFEKKTVLLLTKDFFSRSFQSFHERVSCVKNAT